MKAYPTRSEMALLNQGTSFTAVDYVYFVSREAGLCTDFIASMCEIIDPDLVIIDGVILVRAIGALVRYRKYVDEGQTPAQAQYWSNLLETTSLICDISLPDARRLAAIVATCWKSALNVQHPGVQQEVRVIEDVAEGEVFVTLSSGWPS